MKNAMSDTFREAENDVKQREVQECISYLSEANLSRDQRYCVNVLIQALVEMREEDARLIAAAPCMLEALRNLVMDWERVIGPIPEDHEAQVAIAKAEGETA